MFRMFFPGCPYINLNLVEMQTHEILPNAGVVIKFSLRALMHGFVVLELAIQKLSTKSLLQETCPYSYTKNL